MSPLSLASSILRFFFLLPLLLLFPSLENCVRFLLASDKTLRISNIRCYVVRKFHNFFSSKNTWKSQWIKQKFKTKFLPPLSVILTTFVNTGIVVHHAMLHFFSFFSTSTLYCWSGFIFQCQHLFSLLLFLCSCCDLNFGKFWSTT